MAKTLSDLQTGVRMYLDEAAEADWLDSEVTREINYAYQDVVGRVMEVYENYYQTTTPIGIDTVANQQEYLLDATILKIDRVEINYAPNQAGSSFQRSIRTSMDEIQLQLNNNAAAGALFNSGYYIHGPQDAQYIGFIPAPTVSDTPGTNSIHVWGIQTPALLASSSDPVRIPFVDRFAQLIELKAAASLLRKGQQAEKDAQTYMINYQAGLIGMQMFLKERQSDGPWMIEDTTGESLDFQAMPI